MRVDVNLDHRDVDAELAALYGRLRPRADKLIPLPIFVPRAPELVFKYREVDGEFYVYAEDPERGVLAGCTVFNRVPDLDPQVGCHVRSPHSRYAREYREKGVAGAVYQWAIGAGMSLVSGPRQSRGAYQLWASLARSNSRVFVRVENRRLRVLGAKMELSEFKELGTRMVLMGQGGQAGQIPLNTETLDQT